MYDGIDKYLRDEYPQRSRVKEALINVAEFFELIWMVIVVLIELAVKKIRRK